MATRTQVEALPNSRHLAIREIHSPKHAMYILASRLRRCIVQHSDWQTHTLHRHAHMDIKKFGTSSICNACFKDQLCRQYSRTTTGVLLHSESFHVPRIQFFIHQSLPPSVDFHGLSNLFHVHVSGLHLLHLSQPHSWH